MNYNVYTKIFRVDVTNKHRETSRGGCNECFQEQVIVKLKNKKNTLGFLSSLETTSSVALTLPTVASGFVCFLQTSVPGWGYC